MGEKHCPFMNVRDVIFECYQERCALWINGRCAIVAIAENLSKPDTTKERKEGIKMLTFVDLKTRAKAHDLFIRKDGKGGYLLTDFLNRIMVPGPMTLEEVEMWLDDLDAHQK